jgi:hypothetical protein
MPIAKAPSARTSPALRREVGRRKVDIARRPKILANCPPIAGLARPVDMPLANIFGNACPPSKAPSDDDISMKTRHMVLRVAALTPVVVVACVSHRVGLVGHAPDADASTATDPSTQASTTPALASAQAAPTPARTCPKAPPGVIDPNIHTGCTSDKDCTEGYEGRCVAFKAWGERPASNRCTYDACEHDSDCAHGQLCMCAGPGARNLCETADCHDDADCNGMKCAPIPITSDWKSAAQYCRTTQDTCQSPTDCGAQKTCGYSKRKHLWECVLIQTP